LEKKISTLFAPTVTKSTRLLESGGRGRRKQKACWGEVAADGGMQYKNTVRVGDRERRSFSSAGAAEFDGNQKRKGRSGTPRPVNSVTNPTWGKDALLRHRGVETW